MAKKAKFRRPGLLRTLLAVLVVLALAATLLFTVFRRQIDTMEYPCRYNEYVEEGADLPAYVETSMWNTTQESTISTR